MTTTQTADQMREYATAMDIEHVASQRHLFGVIKQQAVEIERLRETVHQAQDALKELQKGRTFKSKHLAVAAINKCKEMNHG